MIDEDAIRYRWETVGRTLDERGRRLFAAAEVRAAGWGGLAVVSEITGLARSTINRGEDDLDAAPLPPGQVRRVGGGRKAASEKDPGLVPALQRLVEPATLGEGLLTAVLGEPISARYHQSVRQHDGLVGCPIESERMLPIDLETGGQHYAFLGRADVDVAALLWASIEPVGVVERASTQA